MLYLFCGKKRKNSVANCLRQLAKKHELQLEVLELDIQHNRRLDFTQPGVQKTWLQRISAGNFDAVVTTPPCSTFSRAVWANDRGPYPLRSRAFSRRWRVAIAGEMEERKEIFPTD